MNDDFGYASSNNDYYPLDITQGLDFFTISIIDIIYVKSYDWKFQFEPKILGDNYGNSVQYHTFGRIDDSADEWIDDDDLLRTVFL